jgi:cytochrome c
MRIPFIRPNIQEVEKMKKCFTAVLVTVFLMSIAGVSLAASNTDEAKAMVENSIAYLKANGRDKTLAEISNQKGKFVKGDVYVVILDMTATMLAHPYNPKLVGKNLLEVPDPDGKLFRKDIIEMAKTKGSGWVDFKYKNPSTNKVESKTTFIKKADDMIFICGTYK